MEVEQVYENTVVRKKRIDPDNILYVPTIQKVSPDSEFSAYAGELPSASGTVENDIDMKDLLSE